MPNRFQLKRTSTTGLLPNVSNSSNTSYIAAGELAINLTDRKLLSSNGSATFEIGANLASLSVAGALAAGNTTVTGFANVTGNVNAASFSIGTTVIANSTATYATRLNAKTEGNLNVNTAVTSGAVTVTDTRAAQTTPETLASPLVDFDFKQNTTEGLSDGGTYFGEMTFRPYGTTTDWTGGPSHQLGFTSNNNVYHRSGNSTTWGAWSRLYKEGTVLSAGNTTITGFANVSTTATIGTGFTLTSGNANFDSGVLFVDGTNNRVGVNNTTPGHALSVTGTTNLGGAVTGITTLAAGNTTITGFINVSSTSQFNDTVTIANDKRITFTANSTNPSQASKLVHQSDDNFVFYVSSTSGTERAIWSTFSNSNSSAFAVATAITAAGDITAFFSDDRLKDRIGNIPFAVDKVKQLNGFYYTPNEIAQSYGYEDKIHVGVSAQEVFLTVPEAIAPAPIDPQYMTVKYEKLIPLLIQAIKEQQAQIDELKEQLNKD